MTHVPIEGVHYAPAPQKSGVQVSSRIRQDCSSSVKRRDKPVPVRVCVCEREERKTRLANEEAKPRRKSNMKMKAISTKQVERERRTESKPEHCPKCERKDIARE